MGKSLGYHASSKPYNTFSTKGNYDLISPGKPRGLKVYSEAIFDLRKYLNLIDDYKLHMQKPYSEHERIYNPHKNLELKLRCPRCCRELDKFGGCMNCGWSPFMDVRRISYRKVGGY